MAVRRGRALAAPLVPRPRGAFRAVVLLVLLLLGRASALEIEAGDQPVLVQVTEAASVLYNVDNRDTRAREVSSVANDDWGLLYNRLNVQATRGRLTLTLRLDGAWFYASPSPSDIASSLLDREPFENNEARQAFYRAKATEAGLELSNRYINWLYPAKYTLLYNARDFELAVGDSPAQLGRGLVLSVRKLDELASDTTVRGIRGTARLRLPGARFKLSALGGSLNPLRIDEASGRYLGVHESVTPGFVSWTEALMPRAVQTDFVSAGETCARFATCSYAPDRLVAGQAEVALNGLTLATQASLLLRQTALAPDITRTADRVTTASQSVELPKLFTHGSVYVEAALQKLGHDGEDEPDLALGHAVYLAATWATPDFSVLAEGKHYRRFFPLTANVGTARAREFSQLQYSAPPTTEEVWNDTEFGNFNTCVSGGRLRADVHARRTHTLYGWLGHYRSFAESVTNAECRIGAENENRVWDTAVGMELSTQDRRTNADLNFGTRLDATLRELAGPDGATHVFYRELYLRYDIVGPLFGPFGFELQGFHRRRRETVGGPVGAWFEGQHSTGLEWGQRLSLALGVEYDSRPDTPDHFWNVMAAYRPSDSVLFGLFAGQRRGALRCVGGVCRVYPPFEGARLDFTFRY